MLVSSIARFDAINTMNNASFAAVTASNNMISGINNAHTFGAEHDLSMISKMDKKLSLDLLSNKLLYKIAYLQEKLASKHQAGEIKKSLNVLG